MEDSKFVGNMEGAIAAGLDVGAYYFYLLPGDGLVGAEGPGAVLVEEAVHDPLLKQLHHVAGEEAEAFLARLEPYKEHITYPVVCDWEYLGGNDSRAYGVDGRTGSVSTGAVSTGSLSTGSVSSGPGSGMSTSPLP